MVTLRPVGVLRMQVSVSYTIRFVCLFHWLMIVHDQYSSAKQVIYLILFSRQEKPIWMWVALVRFPSLAQLCWKQISKGKDFKLWKPADRHTDVLFARHAVDLPSFSGGGSRIYSYYYVFTTPVNFFWDIGVRFLSWECWDFEDDTIIPEDSRRSPKSSEESRNLPQMFEVPIL